MSYEGPAFAPGDQVKSNKYGLGRVEFDKGGTVLVRFEHGIEECQKSTLQKLWTTFQALDLTEWHLPLEVITKTQAWAIESINDQWGIFSRSRIELLPHQLWVCKKVIEHWPTRWIVADDVGLGKTIEAGLVLWPLLAKGTVKRLLIVCPASLIEQWQYRMRTMFDIRIAQYNADADTAKTDFWGTHTHVIVSLQTLRADNKGRHERLFEADPWDLLIVDEAHHLNADERAGPTLGYKLVNRLMEEHRVVSMVFFTGTPHRGKEYGFLSLLRLLRSDLFDPAKSMDEQLPFLREVMIRNNKQNVTDLKGNKLFKQPLVSSKTYSYSEEETRFYEMLTKFIVTGKAYASSLPSADRRVVMFVLITMQKLASSSVAAIRRALKGRLSRIMEKRKKLSSLKVARDEFAGVLSNYEERERDLDYDSLSKLEEQIAELSSELVLMEDEEPRLQELVTAAEEVKEETKIGEILSLIKTQFDKQHVLFFTEYKATQSLLMSALIREYGDGCVSFINGDNRADDVIDSSGAAKTIYEKREHAADQFNAGKVRFLISTEAGGEGIDLQESCHSLIHVDLPWNPMRLHQRVGRLNRYGQTKQVKVINLRNPDTVESRIWDKLNMKIDNITFALKEVMDEPEDLLQLVLGMTSPTLFREIFSDASTVPKDSLSSWFDQKTAQFGGQDVIRTVKDLVGNCSRFDYQEISSELPPMDLPDLRPFFISMLLLNNRRIKEDGVSLSFKTPEVWRNEIGIKASYENLIFERNDRSKDAAVRVLGIGHKLVNIAINQAKNNISCVATVPLKALPAPLFLFKISDRITTQKSFIRSYIVGIFPSSVEAIPQYLLKDWEVLQCLNELYFKPGIKRAKDLLPPENIDVIKEQLDEAMNYLQQRIKDLPISFQVPYIEVLSIIYPSGVEKALETDVSDWDSE